MPTMEQIAEYAPLSGWFALAAIAGALIKATRAAITKRMERKSKLLRAVDRSVLFLMLPVCMLVGLFMPVPEVLGDSMPPALYWGSAWVGALVARRKLEIGDE